MTPFEYILWAVGLILLIGGGVTWLERRVRKELRKGWEK